MAHTAPLPKNSFGRIFLLSRVFSMVLFRRGFCRRSGSRRGGDTSLGLNVRRRSYGGLPLDLFLRLWRGGFRPTHWRLLNLGWRLLFLDACLRLCCGRSRWHFLLMCRLDGSRRTRGPCRRECFRRSLHFGYGPRFLLTLGFWHYRTTWR